MRELRMKAKEKMKRKQEKVVREVVEKLGDEHYKEIEDVKAAGLERERKLCERIRILEDLLEQYKKDEVKKEFSEKEVQASFVPGLEMGNLPVSALNTISTNRNET